VKGPLHGTVAFWSGGPCHCMAIEAATNFPSRCIRTSLRGDSALGTRTSVNVRHTLQGAHQCSTHACCRPARRSKVQKGDSCDCIMPAPTPQRLRQSHCRAACLSSRRSPPRPVSLRAEQCLKLIVTISVQLNNATCSRRRHASRAAAQCASATAQRVSHKGHEAALTWRTANARGQSPKRAQERPVIAANAHMLASRVYRILRPTVVPPPGSTPAMETS